MNTCIDCGEWERDCTCCPHDETDHGICLSCNRQTDMNAHDYGKSYAPGNTGPRGLALGDYEHPVFDGPQPRARPVPMRGLNTEGDE